MRLQEEPVWICKGPNNSVLVATRSGWVEQHRLVVCEEGASSMELVCRFCAVSRSVERMALLDELHVVLLERSRAGQARTLSVYGICHNEDETAAAANRICSFARDVDEFAVCDEGSGRILAGNVNGMWLLAFTGRELQPLAELSICSAKKLALSGAYVGFCAADLQHVYVLHLVIGATKQLLAAEEEVRRYCVGMGLPLGLRSLSEKSYLVQGPRQNFEVWIFHSLFV